MEKLIDRITIIPEICHGKPTIRGLRYTVESILELLASGMLENEILEDEFKKTIQSALDKLDENLREPIRLFYFEGHSYKDISNSLKIPIGTVMSRIARAKVRLKKDLARTGFYIFPQDETHKVI